nr:substrate-binding domain-containing protein [Actinomyces sp.]
MEGADAVFAGDDLLVIALVRGLSARGCRVPQDVAVCGFDDISWAQVLTPTLTTVSQPARRLGVLGVQAAVRLEAEEQVTDVVEPVRLVVRESTCLRAQTS